MEECKLNSEKIWKMWKKVKVSWNVKWYEKYGRKASRIVIRFSLFNLLFFHIISQFASVFSISFHISTCLSSISFHYFLLYFPYLFTIEMWNDIENTEANCEMIWKKSKLNSEKIWKMWKKIKVSWNVKWYGKCGRKESRIISLFNLPFFHIVHILSLFDLHSSISFHNSTYFSSTFFISFHYSTYKIRKVQKKIAKWYGKYGWNVKWYGRKVKRYGNYGIISQFNLLFFYIFHIFSLFNLLSFHIFNIISQCEMILKIQKQIVKWYGRKVSWIVKRFGK
jgi:hypothetical protein